MDLVPAYKVVKDLRNGTYTSLMARGDWQVDYKVGERAFAFPTALKNGYGLTCFETLKQAHIFASDSSWFERGVLLRVLGYDPVPSPFPRRYNTWSIGYPHPAFSISGWPDGTIMFGSVEILGVLEWQRGLIPAWRPGI